MTFGHDEGMSQRTSPPDTTTERITSRPRNK